MSILTVSTSGGQRLRGAETSWSPGKGLFTSWSKAAMRLWASPSSVLLTATRTRKPASSTRSMCIRTAGRRVQAPSCSKPSNKSSIELGYRRAFLWVEKSNNRAISFYSNRRWLDDGGTLEDTRFDPPVAEKRHSRTFPDP